LLFKCTRANLLKASVLALTMGVGGCGFTPLYGTNATHAPISQSLSAIYISPIPDHSGQMMHIALEQKLMPKGRSLTPQYDLMVSLNESTSTMAVDETSFATHANFTLTANYQLVRRSDAMEILKGSSSTVASYNILSSHFSTIAAQENARKLAIKNLADILTTRLAVEFNRPASVKASPISSKKANTYGYPN